MNRHLTAALAAACILLLALFVAPGSWLVRFQLTVVDGGYVVVQTRSALLDRTFSAYMTAEVEEITGETTRVACPGGGRRLYSPPSRAARETLSGWLRAPCELQPGATYQLSAQWTFPVLGVMTKTTQATSLPFTAGSL